MKSPGVSDENSRAFQYVRTVVADESCLYRLRKPVTSYLLQAEIRSL